MAKQSKLFGNTQLLGALLERIESGDPAAREELLQEAQERLRRMASKMLTGFPALRQQGRAETGMILNDALLKLNESFGQVEFQSPRHFINVAAQKMRFYLIDLARKHKVEIESRQQEIPDFELRESHAIEIGETQNALTQVSVHQHHLAFRGLSPWRFFFLRERVICGRHDRGVRLCGRCGFARDER